MTDTTPDAPAGERERFEAYFVSSRKSKGVGRRPNIDRMSDGTYADDHTKRHWWTWQNALAARASAAPAVQPVAWPIRGARVDGDKVIVTVKGGNDAARWLCGELVALISPADQDAGGAG
jgi:hypothetical protein